jgi:hypothetical protein
MTPGQIEKYVHLEQDRESRFYPQQSEPEAPSPSFAGAGRSPSASPEIPLDEWPDRLETVQASFRTREF